MIDVEKRPDFYQFEKTSSVENSVTLRRGLSPFMGHITRLINKINKKLILNDNFKITKCLEGQIPDIRKFKRC